MTNFEVKVSQRYFIWSFAYEEYRTDDSNSPAERAFSPAASSEKMKTWTKIIEKVSGPVQ